MNKNSTINLIVKGSVKMPYLFNKDICDWTTWGQVFQSIDAFEVLIRDIFIKENISLDKIEQCKPGTNAVFKVGNYIINIYAPEESGLNTDSDYYTEVFGMQRANLLSIPIPKLVAKGMVEDKYKFRYLIMEYIDGQTLGDIENKLSDNEKMIIGEKLRSITDELNKACETFNDIHIINRELNNKRWDIFSDDFNNERIEYLKKLILKDEVYVHGDLNPDNVLLHENGQVYIIDFADALLAPSEYELPAIICELFCLDKAFMKGYFGEESLEDITELCLKGLLIHDFGSNIIRCNFGNINEITSIKSLKDKLYQSIETGRQLDS
jgi:serine/threonine protein kinase